MSDEILVDLYTKLLALSDAGDEAGAKKLLDETFPKLTEAEQGELLTRLYLAGTEQELENADALATVQEEGLAKLDELEAEKKRLEAQEGEKPHRA